MSVTCACGEKKKLSQVKKEGANQGRWFLACPRPQGDQCDRSFQWTQTPKEEDASTKRLLADLDDIVAEEDARERNKYFPRSPSPAPIKKAKLDPVLLRVLRAAHEVQEAALALVHHLE